MVWSVLLGIVLLSIISPVLAGEGLTIDEQEYLSTIESYVGRLRKLSMIGMNTSEVEQYINNALSLLKKGEITIEEKEWIDGNLTMAGVLINRLEEGYSSFAFWRNLEIVVKILGLVSVPLLTYVFLPRIWAIVWFKTRRKWIIKKSRIK